MNKTAVSYNNVLVSILTFTTISFSSLSLAADVVIGAPNWPSGQVTANVLKTLLEDNLGLEVEIQNGNNTIIFEAMDKGSMHVHPEVWLPNQQSLHDKYVKERSTVLKAPNNTKALQGMCVTKGTVDRTGIKNLSDLADPEMAKKFDTDGDDKGDVWIGAPGWASVNDEKVRARDYGYDVTMNLKELDEAIAMAEVDSAVKKKENSVFFCYGPHHIFELYDLVILDEPDHDASKWKVIQPTDDADWFNKSSASTAYPPIAFSIHYSTQLAEKQPEASKLLSKVQFDTDMVSSMTYAVVIEEKDPVKYAKEWTVKNSSLVDSWFQ